MVMTVDDFDQMTDSQGSAGFFFWFLFTVPMFYFFQNVFLAILMNSYSACEVKLAQEIHSGRRRDITDLFLDAAAGWLKKKCRMCWGAINKEAANDAMLLEAAKKERQDKLGIPKDTNLDVPEELLSYFIRQVGPDAMAWFDRLAEVEGNMSPSESEKFSLFLKDNREHLKGRLLALLDKGLLVSAFLKRQIDMVFANEVYLSSDAGGKLSSVKRGAKTRTMISENAPPEDILK
jgi:hypothetical protein